MKRIVLSIALILIAMPTFAQQSPNNITVNGVHQYTISPEYKAKMIVSLNNVYYDTQSTNLEEIKSTYMERLTKAGIDVSGIKEDDLGYALLGYEKDGVVLEYTTNSLEMMKTFLSVRSLGVSKSDSNLSVELTDEQMATYAKAAFDNAKSKAEAIAKKVGRSIGKAIYINDSNYKKLSESMYYASPLNTKDYYISVSFELL